MKKAEKKKRAATRAAQHEAVAALCEAFGMSAGQVAAFSFKAGRPPVFTVARVSANNKRLLVEGKPRTTVKTQKVLVTEAGEHVLVAGKTA